MGAKALTLTRQDMDEALMDSAQIGLLYQPIYRLSDGQLMRVEALCRWEHPRFGTMLPAVFLPAFEEEGKLPALTRRILERAAAEFITWDHRGEAGLSINLSAADLLDRDLAATARAVFADAGIDPSLVTLECPIRLSDAADSSPVLRQLASLGVRLAAEMMGRAGEAEEVFSLAPFAEIKTGGRGLLRAARQNHVASLQHTADLISAAQSRHAVVGAIGAEDEAACLALRILGFHHIQANVLSAARPIAEIDQDVLTAAGPVLGLAGEFAGRELPSLAKPRSDDFRSLRMQAQAEAFKRAAGLLDATRVRQNQRGDARSLQRELSGALGDGLVKHFYPEAPGGSSRDSSTEAPMSRHSQAGMLMRPDLAAASLGYGKSPLRRPKARDLPQSMIVVEPSEEQARLLSQEPAVARAVTDMLAALPADMAVRGSDLPKEEDRSFEDIRADELDAKVAALPTLGEDEAARAKQNWDFSPVADEISTLAARLRPAAPKKNFLTRKYKLRVTHFWPKPWRRAYDRFMLERQSLSQDEVLDRVGGGGSQQDAVSVMPLGADQVGPFTISHHQGTIPADEGTQALEMPQKTGVGQAG
jgi:EAL domain-containing protein (putative c-di-GMP-specific phosphodiesterase class I)